VGEPFGTLVLALAVTVIEVAPVLHREQDFQVKGASAALAVLATLVTARRAARRWRATQPSPRS
jgi:Ca2+/H+ antiporter